MARYKYQANNDISVVGTELQSHYGAGNVTIHYTSSTKLIFTAPAICDKPIKFIIESAELLGYYGSAYNSGTQDIDNPIMFVGDTNRDVFSYHLCLTNNTMLLNTNNTDTHSQLILIGKLVNNAYAVMGFYTDSVIVGDHRGYLTATDTPIKPLVISEEYKTSTGKIMKMPLYIDDPTSGAPVYNGALVAFEGISQVTRKIGINVRYKGTNYYISNSGNYMRYVSVVSLALPCSLLVENIV